MNRKIKQKCSRCIYYNRKLDCKIIRIIKSLDEVNHILQDSGKKKNKKK